MVGYLMQNPLSVYLLNMHNLTDFLVPLLNEPKLILLLKVEWIQIFLSNTINSIYYWSFVFAHR